MTRDSGTQTLGLLSLGLLSLSLGAGLAGCHSRPSATAPKASPGRSDTARSKATAAESATEEAPASTEAKPGTAKPDQVVVATAEREALRVEAMPTTSTFKAPDRHEVPTPKTLEDYHRAWEASFVEVADSFGMTRMIQLRVHTPERLARTLLWKSKPMPKRELIGLELVSLLDGPARTYKDPYKGYADPAQHEQRLATLREAQKTQFPNNGVAKYEQRRPSAFEIRGLAALRTGKSVYASSDGRFALGAIRARKRCTECHVVEVGELMAAFSYTLRPAGAPKSSPEF